MVATTTASVAVFVTTSVFVVADAFFIALSDGYYVDSLAEGGKYLQYFLQLVFSGCAHFRERQGVLVIFLLDDSGDSCRYYALNLVSQLYCGIRTTETILD